MPDLQPGDVLLEFLWVFLVVWIDLVREVISDLLTRLNNVDIRTLLAAVGHVKENLQILVELLGRNYLL